VKHHLAHEKKKRDRNKNKGFARGVHTHHELLQAYDTAEIKICPPDTNEQEAEGDRHSGQHQDDKDTKDDKKDELPFHDE